MSDTPNRILVGFDGSAESKRAPCRAAGLRSVSAKCARHSACPVLVMRGTQDLYRTSISDEPL
jgi:nucleotide-binding universal stress UspA family protein